RQKEFTALNKMIGALLNTQNDHLTTSVARARQKGSPFDPTRMDLFEMLRAELHRLPPQRRAAAPDDPRTRPFFEAYFSHFLEGTEFAVDEATDIVFKNKIPNERPEDAHDILGTFRIVSDPSEMSRIPANLSELERLLKRRHTAIMEARPDKAPGRYKQERN